MLKNVEPIYFRKDMVTNMKHEEFRNLIDVKNLKHQIQKPMIHYYVKDEFEEKFRHLFSIPATEENLLLYYDIALGISNEFDQVAYMNEDDMTFEHFTEHKCDKCDCGQARVKVGLKWLCYECADQLAKTQKQEE